MASQSLYRKWRSQTFGDLVGQEPVIRTLKNALSSGNLAHAYLFTGPRGTGKTSMARLLAKTINCSQPNDGEPCNTCEQCREITAGNSFNVIEIDAASNRGIDSIRELREKVMVPPSTGKYKVYILDEAHMLTVEAFNALLKTLEEPPPHAVFVMATTDVHKMLPTVLSRCQRFDFKRFTTQQIVERLRHVAQHEEVTLEPGSAELIARAAAGGMRDALSLLDQAIAYSGTTISLFQVQIMLGVADPQAIQKFVKHIAALDSASGLHLINELTEAGADLRQINTQVAEYFRAMMLARAGARIADILDLTDDEMREISETAQLFGLEELTECARVFAQNELVQKNQGTPQLGLELAFLACAELHRRAQSGQPLASNVPTRAASAPTPPARSAAPVRPAPSMPVSTPPMPVEAPQPSVPVVTPPVAAVALESQVQSEPAVTTSEELPEWDDMAYVEDEESTTRVVHETVVVEESAPIHNGHAATSPPVVPETVIAVEEEEHMESGSSLTLDDVREKWELIKRRVKSKKDGAKIAAFLNGFVLVGIDTKNTVPVVVIRANMEFHFKSLQNEVHHAAIEWAMKMELQQECTLRLLPPGQSGGGGITIPPPPTINGDGPTLNNLMLALPRQPAHRERVQSPAGAPARPAAPPQVPEPPVEPTAVSSVSPAVTPPSNVVAFPQKEQLAPPPLARNAVVRENSKGEQKPAPFASGETRMAMVTRKVKSDQVVQEVIRMFKADIKDIRLK